MWYVSSPVFYLSTVKQKIPTHFPKQKQFVITSITYSCPEVQKSCNKSEINVSPGFTTQNVWLIYSSKAWICFYFFYGLYHGKSSPCFTTIWETMFDADPGKGGVDPGFFCFTGSPRLFSRLCPLLGGSFQLGCKWLLTMVRPLRISLWDPLQFVSWLTNRGY